MLAFSEFLQFHLVICFGKVFMDLMSDWEGESDFRQPTGANDLRPRPHVSGSF